MSSEPVQAQDVSPEIRRHVTATLADRAARHGVRILFAVESGSRAWGFGSPDSDYDVRFVYTHPRDWYVSLHEPRDVIEAPLDEHLVDLAGWDVRKALRLLLKGNPALYEWLVSPITYAGDGPFRARARDLFERHASRKVLAHHYWSIARTQWRAEIDSQAEPRLKKYFYVVRPLLSLQWVVAEGTPPPIQISALLEAVALPRAVRTKVDALLASKRSTPELGRGPHIAAIDDWALETLAAFDPAKLALDDREPPGTRAEADRLFRGTIGLDAE